MQVAAHLVSSGFKVVAVNAASAYQANREQSRERETGVMGASGAMSGLGKRSLSSLLVLIWARMVKANIGKPSVAGMRVGVAHFLASKALGFRCVQWFGIGPPVGI